MKTDIILCGVGGQGILSIAAIIGEAAMNENLYIILPWLFRDPHR